MVTKAVTVALTVEELVEEWVGLCIHMIRFMDLAAVHRMVGGGRSHWRYIVCLNMLQMIALEMSISLPFPSMSLFSAPLHFILRWHYFI